MATGRKTPAEPRSIPLWQLSDSKPKISLQQAARDGREDIVRVWLDRLPRTRCATVINEGDHQGYTALHYAAMFNRFKIMQLLVTRGADPSARSSNGLTPLHFAAKYCPPYLTDEMGVTVESQAEVTYLSTSLRAVQLLVLEHHCNINAQDNLQTSPLHLACSRGNRGAVEVLLGCDNINIDAFDHRLHTPLHNACLLGDVVISEMLLQKGADVLAENDDGMTSLHLACLEGHTEIVKQILKYGLAYRHRLVSYLDAKKNTPLHLACESGFREIVQAILLHNGDAGALNVDEVAPVHIAARQGFVEIANILLEAADGNTNVLDNKRLTPLHYAAKHNQTEMIEFLLKKGASLDALDADLYTPLLTAAVYGQERAFKCLMKAGAPIDVVDRNRKSCVFLAAEDNHVGILKIIVDDPFGKKLCRGTDSILNTPLHIAAKEGHLSALKVLLEAGVKIYAHNEQGKTAFHLAAETGNLKVVKALIKHERQMTEEHTSIMELGDEDLNTALHLACASGQYYVARYLLDIYADPNAKNSRLRTPVHSAANGGWDQILELILDEDAEIDPEDKTGATPLFLACREGHLESVKVLLQRGAKVTNMLEGLNCLEIAIRNGHDEVALAIIKSDQWVAALRNCTNGKDTPMRMLIRKMPDVAEAVFNRCTTVTSDSKFSSSCAEFEVTFNCEFLEDFQHEEPTVSQVLSHKSVYSFGSDEKGETEEEEEGEEEERVQKRKKYWSTTWGPTKFKKSNHPLAIMVDSEQTNLLSHPLVATLLNYKWRKYTQMVFAINLTIYAIFVFLLTAFALVVFTPKDTPCLEVFNTTTAAAIRNTSDIGSGIMDNSTDVGSEVCSDAPRVIYAPYQFVDYKGRTAAHYWFLFIASIVIVFLALMRLLMEAYQLFLRRLEYIKDWINFLEILTFSCTIVFVWIFHTDCFCPYDWQWQIGIIAVFLAWINLVIFVQKLPLTGIYVVMFLDIFYTFMRMIILSFLLVLSFSFAFYMLFYKPEDAASNLITAFVTPGRSILKTMTMTTGEFEFDDLFHQDGNQTEDVPYIGASVVIWVIFIILMPILLTNLLVGLAVDDIKAIQEEAALKRLALQVELALNVEQRFPYLRRHYLTNKVHSHPNRRLNPCERLLYSFWGGRAHDSPERLGAALNPQQYQESIDQVEQHARQLVNDMEDVKLKMGDSVDRIQGLEDKLAKIAERLNVHVD